MPRIAKLSSLKKFISSILSQNHASDAVTTSSLSLAMVLYNYFNGFHRDSHLLLPPCMFFLSIPLSLSLRPDGRIRGRSGEKGQLSTLRRRKGSPTPTVAVDHNGHPLNFLKMAATSSNYQLIYILRSPLPFSWPSSSAAGGYDNGRLRQQTAVPGRWLPLRKP